MIALPIGRGDGARPTRGELIALLLLLASAFALRMAFLHEPFERDEGLYGYIGQEILRGAIPYRDVGDIKPPGAFYIYGAMIAIFGNSLEAVRVATACYATMTAFFVYRVARFVMGWRAGLSALLLFAVFSTAPLVQGSSSNTEVFMLLPLVLSVDCLLRGVDSGRRGSLAWSGFFAGLAVMVKTVAVPYVALMLAFLAFRPGAVAAWRRRLAECAGFLAPPIATALITLGYFAWHGALADLYYWNVTIHKLYVQGDKAAFFDNLVNAMSGLYREQLLFWLAACAGAILLLVARRDQKTVFLVLLLPVSIFGVAMPGYFYPHYFIQLFPFFAVTGGAFLGWLWERRGWPLCLAVPAVAAGFFMHLKEDYPFYFKYNPAEVSIAKYNYLAFAQSPAIAAYVRERTLPGDYILHWGFEPELYFYSNRRGMKNLATYLGINWAPDVAVAIREMLENIQDKRPVYIILQRDEARFPYSRYPGYRQLEAVIGSDYFLETTVGYADIFRRRD